MTALTEARKLPEVAALVDAAKAVYHDHVHGNGFDGFRIHWDRLATVLEAWEQTNEN